jgi:hypothetical protein
MVVRVLHTVRRRKLIPFVLVETVTYLFLKQLDLWASDAIISGIPLRLTENQQVLG